MPRENQKLKMLYLAQMFIEETDEEKGLTMPQILERLEGHGISAERKAVYRDINALREFGMDIEKYQRAPVEYGLAERRFTQSELNLLVDAVQSSRFLTERKANELVRSIKTLARKDRAQSMDKDLHVDGRIKSQNESVFLNVDIIQEAIQQHRQISFRYFHYGTDKHRQWTRDGGKPREYVRTPVKLIYSDNCYYLAVYSSKHQEIANYRVDRMTSVKLADEQAVRNRQISEFDVEQYSSSLFGMYAGETKTVQLLVETSAMNAIIDRFGRDVEAKQVDENHARVFAKVTVSPVFYAWVLQFGKQIHIEKPEEAKRAYTAYLSDILDSYKTEE